MSKRQQTDRRVWLNPSQSHDTGHLHWTIGKVERAKNDEYEPHLYAQISIADCSRKVTLSYDTYPESDGESIVDRRRKLELLRKQVNDFVDLMQTRLDEIQEVYEVFKKAERVRKKAKKSKEPDPLI